MKAFAILLFLFFQLALSFGQVPDTVKSAENIDTLAKRGALFVMDGIVLQKPYHFNLDSVIEITILTRNKLNEIFNSSAQNAMVVLISRHGAITSYRKKFSSFSKVYKKYLEENKSDDSNLLYVVNGVPIVTERNDDLKKIFDSSGKLKSVKYIKSITAKKVYPEHKRSALIIVTKN